MLKYNKLKDENAYLKQQMHNSFSMISQVRANFQASKEKREQKYAEGMALVSERCVWA